MEMKTSKDTGYGSEWDDNAWDSKPSTDAWSTENVQSTAVVSSSTTMIKYRAVYEFVARNSDEISFQPGDIIMVLKFVIFKSHTDFFKHISVCQGSIRTKCRTWLAGW